MNANRVRNEVQQTGNDPNDFVSTFTSISSLLTYCTVSSTFLQNQVENQSVICVMPVTQEGARALRQLKQRGAIKCFSIEDWVRRGGLRVVLPSNQEVAFAFEQDENQISGLSNEQIAINESKDQSKEESKAEIEKTTSEHMSQKNYKKMEAFHANYTEQEDTLSADSSHSKTMKLDLSKPSPYLTQMDKRNIKFSLPGVNRPIQTPSLPQKALVTSSSMEIRAGRQESHPELGYNKSNFSSTMEYPHADRFRKSLKQADEHDRQRQQTMDLSQDRESFQRRRSSLEANVQEESKHSLSSTLKKSKKKAALRPIDHSKVRRGKKTNSKLSSYPNYLAWKEKAFQVYGGKTKKKEGM
jgi:hypothetical protein